MMVMAFEYGGPGTVLAAEARRIRTALTDSSVVGLRVMIQQDGRQAVRRCRRVAVVVGGVSATGYR